MTDLYTDELFNCGEDMLVSPVSRLVCDSERFRSDAEEPMSARCMGLAYTKCADGTELRRVSPQKRRALVRKYYDPHHALLTAAVSEKLREWGRCLIVDAHSFPAEPLPYEDCAARPDFCIGTDPFHTPKVIEKACVELLKSRGKTVLVNSPFAGTMVPMEHYRRDARVCSVMVEVNRRLYMTPDGNKTEEFEKTRQTLSELIRELSLFI